MNNNQPEDRYENFIESLKNGEDLLFLDAGDGMTASYTSSTYFNNDTQEPVSIIPVWSNRYRDKALACISENWKGCEIVEVSITSFLSEILPELAKACIFIGINIDDKDEEDIEKDPLDIFKDLGLLDEDGYPETTTTNDN